MGMGGTFGLWKQLVCQSVLVSLTSSLWRKLGTSLPVVVVVYLKSNLRAIYFAFFTYTIDKFFDAFAGRE
jgi:hypothetical protein